MHAVFETGGKQYRVAEGDVIRVEKLTIEEGETIKFDQILMVGEGDKVQIGAPFVKGGLVSATVLRHGKDKKVEILKFKRRKNYLRRQGHRQQFVEIRIDSISV